VNFYAAQQTTKWPPSSPTKFDKINQWVTSGMHTRRWLPAILFLRISGEMFWHGSCDDRSRIRRRKE